MTVIEPAHCGREPSETVSTSPVRDHLMVPLNSTWNRSGWRPLPKDVGRSLVVAGSKKFSVGPGLTVPLFGLLYPRWAKNLPLPRSSTHSRSGVIGSAGSGVTGTLQPLSKIA